MSVIILPLDQRGEVFGGKAAVFLKQALCQKAMSDKAALSDHAD